jgi:dTDP-4-dehydrorhamnose reductase
MRFLVTGSAGLVGSQVVRDLAQNHTVHSCYHNLPSDYGIKTKLDLLDRDAIYDIVDKTAPDVIIHLAAITNVDLCESEKQLATKINTNATRYLANSAARCNAFFVYVSTDYVFDGIEGMKKENDAPNPINHYGRTKLDGEKALLDIDLKWCVARTSTPFGVHKSKKSFPAWMVENLKEKKEITALSDQITSPTYVPNLSRMLVEISTKRITGIIHVAGATPISRYDLANMVAEKLGLDKNLIKKTTTDKMNWTAKRPKNSTLDVSYASRILDEKPQSILTTIDLFCKQMT